jgi:hypothetical protein
LLSAPAPVVKELSNGSVYIQLSDSPLDFDTDFERVNAVRQKVKEHITYNIFWESEAPEDQIYDVPDFGLI